MPRIVAGYTIEQDHLFQFLKDDGYVDDDEETLSTMETWQRWVCWIADQPKGMPWPNTFLKDGEYTHAFVTQWSSCLPNLDYEYDESDYDQGIRDKLVALSDNRLDPSKMHFFSLPYDCLRLPLMDALDIDE